MSTPASSSEPQNASPASGHDLRSGHILDSILNFAHIQSPLLPEASRKPRSIGKLNLDLNPWSPIQLESAKSASRSPAFGPSKLGIGAQVGLSATVDLIQLTEWNGGLGRKDTMDNEENLLIIDLVYFYSCFINICNGRNKKISYIISKCYIDKIIGET
ncbi:hypothetical protein Ddc_15678 [Ditylenchus destructor]|nr:hypothetical protein Ddc_15678 [Ditylenchus destructor]